MRKKNSISERVCRELLKLEENNRIPVSEEELAKILGVSRTPVREALKILESAGIVKREKKGVSLRKPTLKEIVEIYDVRSILEGFAARLAAERCREKDLEELEKFSRYLKKAWEKGDPELIVEADKKFHWKIVELSGNSVIMQMMKHFSILERAFRLGHIPPYPSSSKDENPYPHETIIELLRKGEAEECERALRGHIQYAKQGVIEEVLGIKLNHFPEREGKYSLGV